MNSSIAFSKQSETSRVFNTKWEFKNMRGHSNRLMQLIFAR